MAETSTRSLYETDYYAWTQEQAALLRGMAAQRVDIPLDLMNLAEEVEGLGAAERNAIRSQIRRIIEHLLKLEFSRTVEPRGEWEGAIIDGRAELADKISPRLRHHAEGALPDLYERARRKAVHGLRRSSDAQAADDLPESCPYSLDDIFRDDWYPANRHGLD